MRRASDTLSEQELVGAAALSAVAGYVDSAGFLALFGLFTAHITGDLVAAGALVAEDSRLGAWERLAMIPVFMLAVAGTSLYARRLRERGESTCVALLVLMTVALALFCATGVLLEPLARAHDPGALVLIGGTGVVAMAIQNTLMRDALRGWSPTTLMTGNLTQITMDLVEIALPAREGDRAARGLLRREAKTRLAKLGIPLVAFTAGALLGSWVTRWVGLWSIALPTLAVGVLTTWLRRSLELRGSLLRNRRPGPARRFATFVPPLP
jgi:uncharacterized membrane protein YoaK (UPF0700 family)